MAYNNVAAVYSQLDTHHNFNYSNYAPNQSKQTQSQRNYRNATSTPNTVTNQTSTNNENTNVAAAILSSLGSYSVGAQNQANNYSAALYYHPYYSAHYLHHPNSN